MTPKAKTLNLARLYTWLVGASCFPQAEDAAYEQRKLNVLRIVIGAIALWRTLKILYTAPYYFSSQTTLLGLSFQTHTCYAALESMLLVAFMCGLCTPFVTLVLLLTYNHFDATLGTATLGTNILTLLFFMMLAANAGTRYSMDAWLLNRRPGRLQSVLRRQYRLLGMPSARQLTLLYLLLFVAFALVSFGSALHHLGNPDWMAGRTVGVLLTNSYLCRFYAAFRQLEAAYPAGFMLFSAAAILVQTTFQFLMIPLMFCRWGKRFVVLQGVAFFAMSATLLQLSYLPYLEFALWTAVFLDKDAHRTMGFWLDKLRGRAGTRQAITGASTMGNRRGSGADSLLGYGRPGWVQSALPWSATIAFALFVLCFPKGATMRWYVCGKLQFPEEPIRRALYYVGLDVPNVFNKTDLGMGDMWPLLYRKEQNGTRSLVPLNGPDGQRLGFHSADTLYFGNSLLWRRSMIGKHPTITATEGGRMRGFLESVMRFDYRLNDLSEATTYEVEVYANQASNAALRDLSARYAPRLVLTFAETIDLSTPSPVAARRLRTAHADNHAESATY